MYKWALKTRFSTDVLLSLANDTRYCQLTIVTMKDVQELVCDLSNGVTSITVSNP